MSDQNTVDLHRLEETLGGADVAPGKSPPGEGADNDDRSEAQQPERSFRGIGRQMSSLHGTHRMISMHTVMPARQFSSVWKSMAERWNYVFSSMGICIVVFCAIVLFELLMYGSRESCYHDMSESHEEWKTHCAFRTYWLAAALAALSVMVWVPLSFYGLCFDPDTDSTKTRVCNFIMILSGGCMGTVYIGSCMFLPQTILGYPGIILADLNHWHVAHLPLSGLAGTDTNGIYLSGNDAVRIAVEYAVSADGECMERKKDCKNCQAYCTKFRQVCLAPVVNAVDFNISKAAYDLSVSAGSSTLWGTAPPAVPVTAWAKCQGYGLCTQKGDTAWSATAFNDPCVEAWTQPATAEGKMHVVSYFGQGYEWKDSGGYDTAIEAASSKGLETAARAVVVSWGVDPVAQKKRVEDEIYTMSEHFAIVICVCTLLQLALMVIAEHHQNHSVFILLIYTLWGIAFVVMGVLRYAYSLDLQMHIFDKHTSGIMLAFGGVALGGGYAFGFVCLFLEAFD
jgi:hypothetical protein